MYKGISSHHDAKRVTSYAQAEAALERAMRTTTGKQRAEKPNGYHLGLSRNHGVTWVKRWDDGKIAFRLYETEVVTWAPDNSVEIDNFGTVTTSGFASRFLPAGISLNHPVTKRGDEKGNKGICYATDDGWRICQGGVVRMVQDGERWVPDETSLDPVTLLELDRKAARGLGGRLHLKAFEDWLVVAPQMLDLDHEGFDLEECVRALEARDFRTAAVFLPTVKIPNGWGAEKRIKPLPIAVASRDEPVTMGSIGKLKLAVWWDEGMLCKVTQPTWSCKAHAAGMQRVNQLLAMGGMIAHSDYGCD